MSRPAARSRTEPAPRRGSDRRAVPPQRRADTAAAASTASTAAQRAGNRGLASALAQSPELAHRFGLSPAEVPVHADAATAGQARAAGAAGFTDGHAVGLDPQAPDPRRTLAHEYAHVAQHRGGNTATSAPVQTAAQAELQADQAASAALAGRRPQVGAYRSRGLLLDGPKPAKGAPGSYTFSTAQIRQWRAAGQNVLYQIYRVHLHNVYPGATEQDVADCLQTFTALTYAHGASTLDDDIAYADKKAGGRFKVFILPALHQNIQDWVKAHKGVDVAPLNQAKAGSPDGKGDGGGGAGGGSGAGPGAGTGTGTGTGADAGKTGGTGSTGGTGGTGGGGTSGAVPDSPLAGQTIQAPDLDAAMAQVQKDLDDAQPKVTTTEADGNAHLWPAQLSDPEQRKAILDLMKEIVGEPMAQPPDTPTRVPLRLSLTEASYLLKIARSDKETRDAIVARLRGNGDPLQPRTGQTLAQALDTAIANTELAKHAGEMGVDFDMATGPPDPSDAPVENRPVHGRIVNLAGALSPGERSVWKFEVEDDRDAFRVPMVRIAWIAFRRNTNGTEEKVSSENTTYITVRAQGIVNDSEFDFTVRETGNYVVKAIVDHNFFRPAYFEEPFVVEDEFEQSDREFKEGHGEIVKDTTGWNEQFYDQGGDLDYRLGRKRSGTLAADVHGTTNTEMKDALRQRLADIRVAIDKLEKDDPASKDSLEKAYEARAEEIEKQIAKINENFGVHTLVAKGQFNSRVRDVDDATMNLACSLDELPSADGGSTLFKVYVHDATTRPGNKIYHFESKERSSVEAAQRDIFEDMADAYPFGTVTVLFQGYDHHKHAPTQKFVQFQKKTDSVAKDIKSVVFDDGVDTAVNVVGFILSIIPFTAPIGITMLVAYNTAKAISQDLDDYQTGNFETKTLGIQVADLVLNLLPLAPKIVKIGKVAYFAIRVASIGGTVVLMTAVGLESVRQLRADHIDRLMLKQQEYEKLKRDNPANPKIANGTLLAEIEQLKKETADATVDVFTKLAAQAAVMHAVSHGADAGFKAMEPGGAVETRLLSGVRERQNAVGGLEEAGAFKHVDDAAPHYDYSQRKVVADGNTIKPAEFNGLAREMTADAALENARVTAGDRAAVGGEVARTVAEVRPGESTQVIVGADGRAVLVVGPAATAAEIRTALGKVKPETGPKPVPKTFVPVEKPTTPAATRKAQLARQINSQLSPEAVKVVGTVEVEIVPDGTFVKGKTRAQVVQRDGKTIVRFEGEPRPGMVAEEVAHVEQLADPKFRKQTALLDEASGTGWSGFSDAKKIEAHKARLVLEIDAQKKVIGELMGGATTNAPPVEVQDVDAAFQNLEQLRHKLGELVSLGEEAKSGALADRPDYLDEPPVLANRKTTNKTPLPPDWQTMNQKDFIQKYRETYPDTTLTNEELRDRHRNGMRLNPETGRMKDPTLVDNPAPDVPAVKENPQKIAIDDLQLAEADKAKMKQLLEARDKARRARDVALARDDEETAALKARDVNEASRQLGEAHAKAFMEKEFPEFRQLYPSDPTKPSRSGDFDQIWVKYGKSASGKKIVVEVIVIEAKGGASPLGARKTPVGLAQQGTGAYFESIVTSMENGTPEMAQAAAVIRTVQQKSPGAIEYKLVRAPVEMTPGAKPRSTVVAIQVNDFNLARTMTPPP